VFTIPRGTPPPVGGLLPKALRRLMPTPAAAIALIALAVALSGVSLGAVAGAQKAAPRATAAHRGPRGPRGPQGPPGPPGPAGAPALSADLFADRQTVVSLGQEFEPVVGSSVDGSTTGGPIHLARPARIVATADARVGSDVHCHLVAADHNNPSDRTAISQDAQGQEGPGANDVAVTGSIAEPAGTYDLELDCLAPPGPHVADNADLTAVAVEGG
jgi:hypothetical protein